MRGIYFSNCDNAEVDNVMIDNCGGASYYGIYIYNGSDNVAVTRCKFDNNYIGIYIRSSVNCKIIGNTISNSKNYGIYFNSSSNNNYFAQNDFINNASYDAYITSSSSNDTFVNNNFFGNTTGFFYNNVNSNINFAKSNYYETADSSVIKNKILGTYSSKMLWQPFRTSPNDTAIGADTVAPVAPSGLYIDTSVSNQVTLRWTKPTLDEGGATLSASDTNLFGYRIYRAKVIECRANGDTDHWEDFFICEIKNPNDTYFIDTGLPWNDSYYYKVAAFDSHYTNGEIFQNRSWYSNSVLAKIKYEGPVYYVNDTSSVNDIYNLPIGSDTMNVGNETYPLLTITAAMEKAMFR